MTALRHPFTRRLKPRSESSRKYAQPALVAGMTVLSGLLVGRIAESHYGVTALGVLIALPLLYTISRYPLAALAAILIVVSTIVSYNNVPRVHLPGNPPITVADVLLLSLVAGTWWRRRYSTWPRSVRHYTVAVIGFLLISSVAAAGYSLTGVDQLRDSLAAFDAFLYLLVAATIAVELSSQNWRQTLDLLIVIAAVVSVVSIAAAVLPTVASALSSATANGVTAATSDAVSVGAPRVRFAGLFLVSGLVLPTLVLVLLYPDRYRWLRALALLFMIGAVAVSLNRNMYVALVLGFALTALLGGSRFRLGAIIAIVFLVGALVVSGSLLPGVSSTLGSRASSLLDPATLSQTGSIQDRAYEYHYAFLSIAAHPWVGVGPKAFYGAYLLDNGISSVRFFVQNFFVNTAVDYGIPATLAVLLIPLVVVFWGVRALASGRRRHISQSSQASQGPNQALLASLVASVVVLLLSSLIGTYLQDAGTIAAFAVICGLLLGYSEHYAFDHQPHL